MMNGGLAVRQAGTGGSGGGMAVRWLIADRRAGVKRNLPMGAEICPLCGPAVAPGMSAKGRGRGPAART